LPLCNNTTIIKNTQITTCKVVIRYTMPSVSIATKAPFTSRLHPYVVTIETETNYV
jgi:hypothetical protein